MNNIGAMESWRVVYIYMFSLRRLGSLLDYEWSEINCNEKEKLSKLVLFYLVWDWSCKKVSNIIFFFLTFQNI